MSAYPAKAPTPIMSIFLYRLGRTAYRRPWAFIAAWVLILGAVVGLAATNGGGKISSSVTIDGTQSQDVLDQLRAELPAAAGGQGTIVFTVPEGERLDSGERAAGLARATGDISGLPVVVDRSKEAAKQAVPPAGAGSANPASQPVPSAAGPRPLVIGGRPVPGVVVSDDGSVAMLQIQFTEQVQDLPDGTIERVVDLAENGTAGTGVEVLPSESLKPMEPPIGGHEAIGLGVAALVLLLTLGSMRAAGLPLVTALTGVGIGLGGAFALSQSIQLTTATPVLALMVGLAVGMDYALFIVNRQRRLILTQGLRAEEAASRALGTAGSAVLFAGLTVVIALVGLSIIGISFLTTMALVAAATVVLAVLIALTLLPALLGIVGEGIASTRAREKGEESPSRSTGTSPTAGRGRSCGIRGSPRSRSWASSEQRQFRWPRCRWGCRTARRPTSTRRSAAATTRSPAASGRGTTARSSSSRAPNRAPYWTRRPSARSRERSR